MTLLVGIQCTDGVVLGAESGATLDTDGSDVKETAEKLSLLGASGLVAIAGHSGTGIHYENSLRFEAAAIDSGGGFTSLSHCDAARRLSTCVGQIFLDLDLPNLALKASEIDGKPALSKMLAVCLIGVVTADGPCLIYTNEYCASDLAVKVPYFTVGVGSVEAAPFLRYISHHVWKERRPDLGTGILSVLWALRYACHVNPDMLTPPFKMGVVQNIDGRSSARTLSPAELSLHNEFLDEFEANRLGTLSQGLDPQGSSAMPPTPDSAQPS